MMLSAAAGAAYTVEISALQTYQSKLLGIMDSMFAQSVALGMNTAAAGSSDAGLGNFPEAQSLASAYQNSMQTLMTNFEEITQLVNTMTTVLGTAGKNYAETEQQLTDQFNQIALQYQSQAGSFSPNPVAPGPTATPDSGSSSTTTTSTTASTGSTASTATTGPSYSMPSSGSSTSSTEAPGT
jgi:hypothetical protein